MAVELGTAYGYLDLNTGKFTGQIADVKSQLKGLQDSAGKASDGIESFGSKMTSTGKTLQSVGGTMSDVGGTLTKSITLPLAAAGAAGLKVAGDFEKGMSSVKAITGATQEDFTALRDEAIKLGADTAFSSGEVADAMTEMAKAGWSTQQILDGMNGVLAATAASGEQLGTVSTIVADAITGFGLKASDSTRVADLLTQAANSGTIGISDLGETFKYIAPVAASMNMSIEDVTQAITAMSKAGIKGSQAGTSLRGILLNLVNPSDDAAMAMQKLHISASNSDGSFKSLDEIINNLQTSMGSLTDAEKAHYAAILAGKNASSGLLAILNMTPEAYLEVGESMDSAGGIAEKTAAVMQDNLQNKIEQLQGSMESLAIRMGDLVIPTFTKLAISATDFVNKLTELDSGTQAMILKTAVIAASIGPILIMTGNLLTAIGKISETGGAILNFFKIIETTGVGAFTKLATTIGTSIAPILLTAAAIAAVIAIFAELYQHNEQFRTQVNALGKELLSVVMSIKDGVVQFASTVYTALQPAIATIQGLIKEFVSGFGGATETLGAGFANMIAALTPVFELLKAYLEPIVELFGVALVLAISTVMGAISGLIAALNPLIAAIGNIFSIFGDLVNIITAFLSGNSEQLNAAITQLKADIAALFSNLIAAAVNFVSAFATTFGETFVGLFSAFGVNIVAILTGVVDAIINFFTVTIPEAFSNFVTVTIPEFVASVTEWFEQLPYNIGFVTGEIIAAIIGLGLQLIDWVATSFSQFINSIVTFFNSLPDTAASVSTGVVNKFRDLGVKLIEWVIVKIPEFVNTFVNFIAALPGKIWEWIKTIPEKVSAAGEAMKQSGKDIMNALWDGLKAVWDGIASWFGGIVDDVKNWVRGIMDGISSASSASAQVNGSHAGGLSYVPFNGYVAQLHEGEQVLTRNQADEYRNGGDSGGYTFIFNSPKAIDPYEADKLFRQTVRELNEGML